MSDSASFSISDFLVRPIDVVVRFMDDDGAVEGEEEAVDVSCVGTLEFKKVTKT